NVVRALLRPDFEQNALLDQINQIKAQRFRRNALTQRTVFAVGDRAIFTNVLQRPRLTVIGVARPRRGDLLFARIIQRHSKAVGPRIKRWRLMPGLLHDFHHAVNTEAQFFNIAPLEQAIDHARIAAEMLINDVIHRDEPRQATGRNHFETVRIHPHFDAPPLQPIVAVADRVDDCFAHSKLWIFKRLFTLQPFDNRADRHLAPDEIPCRFDQLGQRPGKFFAPRISRQTVFAARGLADKLDEYDATLRQPILRILAEQQNAGYRWITLGIYRTDLFQQIVHLAVIGPFGAFGTL